MQRPPLPEIVRVAMRAEAPADAIWAILTDFGRPELLAPSIDRCRVTGEGVGAVRIVESSRGLSIHERLTVCDRDAFRFQYEVLETGDVPFEGLTSYRATVTLSPVSPDETIVAWLAEGQADGATLPAAAFLDALYRAAIGNLAAHARKAAG